MHQCKNGHAWAREHNAQRCCAGFERVLLTTTELAGVHLVDPAKDVAASFEKDGVQFVWVWLTDDEAQRVLDARRRAAEERIKAMATERARAEVMTAFANADGVTILEDREQAAATAAETPEPDDQEVVEKTAPATDETLRDKWR